MEDDDLLSQYENRSRAKLEKPIYSGPIKVEATLTLTTEQLKQLKRLQLYFTTVSN